MSDTTAHYRETLEALTGLPAPPEPPQSRESRARSRVDRAIAALGDARAEVEAAADLTASAPLRDLCARVAASADTLRAALCRHDHDKENDR